MKYLSTRDTAQDIQPLTFTDMVFAGLAPDGGLYVPEYWPKGVPSLAGEMAGKTYAEIAENIILPFRTDDDISAQELRRLLQATYAAPQVFRSPDISPLRQINQKLWLLELFHGPTLAFKDYALQFLGRLFDYLLEREKRRITIIGATSGDTGSAAINACAGLKRANIFILHPAGRISDIQRRQMTTVLAPNVFNLAVDGTFDDCQAMVKALFSDQKLSQELHLCAINSINWARIVAQVAYYVVAMQALANQGRTPVSFVVPTGNFGNVFAGHVARLMGFPVQDLLLASNQNDVLPRFFKTGQMKLAAVTPSLSPSMDIQVSSNFERYLFDLVDHDPSAVAALMKKFSETGEFTLNPDQHARAQKDFIGSVTTDVQTLETIKAVHAETGIILDPHTAVGVHAALRHLDRHPEIETMVALATAHPSKFPDAIEKAIGQKIPLPDTLAGIMKKPERLTPVRKDLDIVRNYIRTHSQPS